MPSERFKRLPEEKQKKIRDACMAEYTRTTIEKASLNRMIENAGISRGSFYTYFDSKWDVLGYLCESFINEFYECGERCLEAAQGDIWEMLRQSLNGSLALCRDQKRADFIRNIMAAADKFDDCVASDKTRPACYEYSHFCTRLFLYFAFGHFMAIRSVTILPLF